MMKPGGTGRPRLVISARLAPLPPSRSLRSVLPSAKVLTYFVLAVWLGMENLLDGTYVDLIARGVLPARGDGPHWGVTFVPLLAVAASKRPHGRFSPNAAGAMRRPARHRRRPGATSRPPRPPRPGRPAPGSGPARPPLGVPRRAVPPAAADPRRRRCPPAGCCGTR